MDNNNLYKDIKARTNGEIYIGVAGPVRSGKSTFIKRFMDVMIIPSVADKNERERIIDELPQSSAGKTVMTTEPKFIPKDAVRIEVEDGVSADFKLIDCVGFIVNGAAGITEDGKERLVKTPWFEKEIPFSQAAEYGTSKVIKDHSTIGIAITTDGSIGEFSREKYLEAEEKTIKELKAIRKPFVVVVNSVEPAGENCRRVTEYISQKYDVTAVAFDCENMTVTDFNTLLKKVLYEFPVNSIEFYMPKWAEMLPEDNEIITEMYSYAGQVLNSVTCIKDIKRTTDYEGKYINKIKYDAFDFNEGIQRINIKLDEKYYYKNLSELTGENIEDEYALIDMITSLSHMKRDYERYISAARDTKISGYGVVMPLRDEIELSEPELIKTGNKFGVKIKAQSPSIHMIRVNVGTEISPILGSEEQAKDLIDYISNGEKRDDIWSKGIFGKSIGQLVEDQLQGKIQLLSDDCKTKLQDTMQKVVNENSGGIVCLII